MKGNGMVKLIIVYLIVKVIGEITGLSYNVFAEEFNLIKLLIDIAMWLITYFLVDMIFSKLQNKHKDLN